MESTVKKSKATRAFVIALVILLTCSLFNWGFNCGWGNVRVTRIYTSGIDGKQFSALMYVPANATNANPAPGMLMYHGGAGNARNHESWAVEFARRGCVVISVDNNGAGNSEFDVAYTRATSQILGDISAKGNYDVPLMFATYMKNLPFVNQEEIIVSGHSRGGKSAAVVAKVIDAEVLIGANSVATEFISEEGNFFEGDILIINGTADKLNALEATRETALKIFQTNGHPEISALEVGKLYGSFAEKNAAQFVEIEGQIHEAAFTSHEHIATLINYVQNCMDLPNPIDGNNQAWLPGQIVGLLGMFALLAFFLAFANLLLEKVPFFNTIKQPMPRNIGLRGKGLTLSIVAALVFPFIAIWSGGLWIWKANIDGKFMPFYMGKINHGVATLFGLCTLGVIMLVVYALTEGKKDKAQLCDYGVTYAGEKTINLKLVGKSLLLALITIGVTFAYLQLQESLVGLDFYFLYFGIKPIDLSKLAYYVPYILVYIACFIIAALGMNVERRLPSTGNENKDLVIAIVFNTVLSMFTIAVMIFLEHIVQLNAGNTMTWFRYDFGADVTRMWAMPVGMTMAGIGQTYLYRKSGSIWLGAFTMGLFCCMACVLYGTVGG